MFFSRAYIQLAFDACALSLYRMYSSAFSCVRLYDNYYSKEYNDLLGQYAQLQEEYMKLHHAYNELSYIEHNKNILKRYIPGVLLYDFSYMLGSIIYQEQSPIKSVFYINRGKQDDVLQDMSVVSSHMLLGKIVSVHNWYSAVLAITDPGCKVAVIFEGTSVTGIVQGKGNGNLLQASYVYDEQHIKKGQRVYTSGQGLLFPPGLLVGTVENVIADEGLYVTVLVSPAGKAEVGQLCQILSDSKIDKADQVKIKDIFGKKDAKDILRDDQKKEKKIAQRPIPVEKMVVQKPIDNVIDKKNNVKKTDIQEKEQAVQTVFSAQHAPADLKEQVPPVALYKDVDSDDMTKNTVPLNSCSARPSASTRSATAV